MRRTRWKIRRLTTRWTSACALLFALSGCLGSTRVVYVPDGASVRLAEPVKAKVWVNGADGKPVKSDNKVEIKEGWYALPLPEDKGAKK